VSIGRSGDLYLRHDEALGLVGGTEHPRSTIAAETQHRPPRQSTAIPSRATLGDEMLESFIRNKKIEWDEYKAQVSEFEIKRYLPLP
jgi:glutamine synthetase